MKILITGIHGFVGSGLVKAFKSEHTLYGLDIMTSAIEGVDKTFSCAQMKDIPDVDVVIHVAGKSIETYDLSKALEYFEANAGMSRKIFGWFTQSKAKMFIYFSSVKAATSDVKSDALTEDMEPNPYGPLGESKLMAEKYILGQFTVNKKVYVLRPNIIHGQGSLGNINMKVLFKWVMSEKPFPLGQFECLRSFTSMDNLTFVLKQMLVLDIPAGIYNVTDDGFLTMREITTLMGSVLHKKVRIWNWNKSVICFIARIGTLLHLYFNVHLLRRLSANFVVSNEKIKKALGIEKMPHSMEDGLRKSIRYYSRNNN